MGVETVMIVMAAVSAGATVGKMGMEYEAAQEREKALDLQAKESELQYQQKTLSNLDTMEKVLGEQVAAMTTRGVAFSSPSFNAIQRGTFNIGAKRQKNIEIERSLTEANIDVERENVTNTLYAQLFGDTAQLAMNVASVAAKMPSKLPQMEE